MRKKRIDLGKTQYDIAREAGVRPELINRLENGRTQGTLASLWKICPVLGTSIDELMRDESAPVPANQQQKKVKKKQ